MINTFLPLPLTLYYSFTFSFPFISVKLLAYPAPLRTLHPCWVPCSRKAEDLEFFGTAFYSWVLVFKFTILNSLI